MEEFAAAFNSFWFAECFIYRVGMADIGNNIFPNHIACRITDPVAPFQTAANQPGE